MKGVEDSVMIRFTMLLSIFFVTLVSNAQTIKGLPSIPTSSGSLGFKGSVGAGFADFKTQSPASDFRLERGTYFTGALERPFNVMHLHLTFGLNYMAAEGQANYDYSNLSTSTAYSMDDIDFKAQMFEVTLGLKFKLIEEYWFRPYIEGGGIGSYNNVNYGSRISDLNSVGADFKRKDVIMGSGYYAEAGFEIQFNPKFGVRLAARQANVQTKKLETLGNRPVLMQNEIYYLSMLFGM